MIICTDILLNLQCFSYSLCHLCLVQLICIISFLLLPLGLIFSFSRKFVECKSQVLHLRTSFLMYILIAISLYLRTVFGSSYKFCKLWFLSTHLQIFSNFPRNLFFDTLLRLNDILYYFNIFKFQKTCFVIYILENALYTIEKNLYSIVTEQNVLSVCYI